MKLQRNIKNGFIEMVFGPLWTYISSVRSFLQNFLSITLTDNKWAEVISTAASELVENAVKYSSEDGVKISIEHDDERRTLCLTVENYANTDNLKVLTSEVEKINTGEPEEAYLKKMQEVALRTDGGSQLGLARIRYESDAEISINVDGNLVKVTVLFDLK